MRPSMSGNNRRHAVLLRLLRGMGVLIFWLFIWAALARLTDLPLLLPGPLVVLKDWLELARTSVFRQAVAFSILRVLCGFAAGMVLGVALACLTSRSRAADILLGPAIRVIRATPVASFILLAVLWIKSGVLPGFIAGLMVMPIAWDCTVQGICTTDAQLLEMARCYRFGRIRTIRLIYLPSLAAQLRTAAATGLGLAWKSGVAAEVLCAPRLAIGRSLNDAKIYLQTPRLFAWTLTILVLSLAMERGLRRLLRRLPGGRET